MPWFKNCQTQIKSMVCFEILVTTSSHASNWESQLYTKNKNLRFAREQKFNAMMNYLYGCFRGSTL